MVMNRKAVWIAVVVVLLVAVFIVANVRQDRSKQIEVQTEKVLRRNIVEVVTASGSIRPKRMVSVSASQMGTVVDLAVSEGNEVREGDFLLQIDPVQYTQTVERLRAATSSSQAEVRLAEANLQQAVQERERIHNLRNNDLASSQEMLKADTNLNVAMARKESAIGILHQQEASLRKAEHDLSLTTIRAPMTGVVVELNVEEGETAIVGTMNNPGTVLLTIADLSELEAEVEVDETDVVGLRVGMEAKIVIDSYPDTSFSGTVTEIGNSALRRIQSTESVDFKVVVTLKDPVPGAKPGLSATADIIVAFREKALSVPIQSLTIRPVKPEGEEEMDEEVEEILDDDPTVGKKRSEREGVFVIRDREATFVPTVTGIAGDRFFEVISGVEENDLVVSGDFQAIRDLEDGDKVQTTDGKTDNEK